MQKKIIIFIVILFIACSVWLFAVSSDYLDPDQNKNWWSVYFSNPASSDLIFTIDNHSDKTDFHFEISADNKKIDEGDVKINKGEKADFSSIRAENKKITVTISSGDEKKAIYKNF